MEKECIEIRQKETAIKVLNTKIDAIRMKDIVKKGMRVYGEGLIGISGAIGNVPDETLTQLAIDNLSVGIKYPYELTKQDKDHRDYCTNEMSPDQFMSVSEQILTFLRNEFPQFDFSEKIGINEVDVTFKNSEGLDLNYKDSTLEIELIIKEKSSVNLFDGFVIYQGRTFDFNQFIHFNKMLLRAHDTPVPLPKGEKLPVFMMEFGKLNVFLNKALNGENYANNSSIFSSKMGKKLFSSKLTVQQNLDPKEMYRPFFDHEGVKIKGDKQALIHKGVLQSVFTDKKTADVYGLPHTGGASGEYDSMPTLSSTALRFQNDSEHIKKALNGKPAILVFMSEGGDFTAEGNYAAPVQLSYLFDGERITGKLPEFTVTSTLFEMLGNDYIGTFENPFYVNENGQLLGAYFTIK